MTPIAWALKPLKRYADFKGRAPRPEYWWFIAAVVVCSFLAQFVDNIMGTSDVLSAILNLAVLLPSVAVTIRRLHDTDRTGWWLLIYVIPFVVVVIVAIWLGLGSVPAENVTALFVILGLAMFAAGITLFVFLVLPGTGGPNRYGPDPYGPSQLEQVFA